MKQYMQTKTQLPPHFYNLTAKEIKEILEIELENVPDDAIFKSDQFFHYNDEKIAANIYN